MTRHRSPALLALLVNSLAFLVAIGLGVLLWGSAASSADPWSGWPPPQNPWDCTVGSAAWPGYPPGVIDPRPWDGGHPVHEIAECLCRSGIAASVAGCPAYVAARDDLRKHKRRESPEALAYQADARALRCRVWTASEECRP